MVTKIVHYTSTKGYILMMNIRVSQAQKLNQALSIYVLLISDVYYSGHENPLKLQREFKVSAMCTYDLAYYPFDTQRCPLILYIQFYTAFHVTIKLTNLHFSGTRRLLEYRVRQ